ncbi:MAG TPA: efflux RND transporter periplasmic adaptor subunit [Solimonas sp.]|nr:efflux RND transporter periplasmic adaptor subunit [Solimonas sp.]
MLTPRRLLALTLILLTLAACGREATAPAYTTAKVERGDVVASVTAGGALQPLVLVQVGTQVSGRIAELGADFNSKVTKGDVIARIDPQTLQSALARADANVQAAQGNLARVRAGLVDAERQASRAQELLPQGLVSKAEADTVAAKRAQARADVDVQRGALAQAQAARQEAALNLEYTVIRSPTDGIVISRSVDVGQTVAASLQAPVLFTIAQDLKQMQVHVNVAESDVGQLREGMPAEFTVDAYPSERFKGVIRQIRVSPTTTQNVVTYITVVGVDNPELKLKPGMSANVTFRTAEAHDVLRVPAGALRIKPPAEWTGGAQEPPREGRRAEGGGRGPREPGVRRLWKKPVSPKALPQPVRVKVGVSDGSFSEITVIEGELAEGEEVIASVKPAADASKASPMTGGGPRVF